ncbi:hypothetical protein RhiirA5_432430 [Rhizophagus irregularis]|uniref:Uncharacterized protein n=1 Tax=Rhizophagus irregularis TaxID=588596 RepID=A0A2I1FHD8_9GLOM|nr:hypothetical protein RhiirA5_432430 [Rhizophagus irregularis]PKY33806.1 hypothetical protein RhiirB3_453026 [Rhizophagus irregularis]UZO15687.1 hypothetical protein OCT59_007103 [Rhizophagus irregularis]
MSYKNNQQQEDNDKQQDNNKQQEFYILVNNNLAPFASHHSDHTVLDIFEMVKIQGYIEFFICISYRCDVASLLFYDKRKQEWFPILGWMDQMFLDGNERIERWAYVSG